MARLAGGCPAVEVATLAGTAAGRIDFIVAKAQGRSRAGQAVVGVACRAPAGRALVMALATGFRSVVVEACETGAV